MQMIILQMPLVSTLRPSANLSLLRLDVLNFSPVESLSRCENDNPGPIGISEHNCITAILIDQTSQRIKMRTIVDEELILLEWSFELSSLEKVTRAGTSKDRQALCRRPEFIFEKSLDPYKVFLETVALWRVGWVRARTAPELFVNEGTKVMFALIVCATVEIETNHRQFRRIKSRETLEQFFRQGRVLFFVRRCFWCTHCGASPYF